MCNLFSLSSEPAVDRPLRVAPLAVAEGIAVEPAVPTVSFQNFKLSVSNPKSKYVAHLSVLSQIYNCQSLGRENQHEILKTDPPDSLYNY